MFNGNSMGKFENMTLPLPVYPDLYLRALYGDYMKLPPIEDRKPRHVIV
jgi:lipopolysaccharide cholinephosphotransferase